MQLALLTIWLELVPLLRPQQLLSTLAPVSGFMLLYSEARIVTIQLIQGMRWTEQWNDN